MQIEDKKIIYDSFKKKTLQALSSSEDKIVEWKKITEVMRHDVSEKKQYKVVTKTNKSCEVTEDHSLFIDKEEKIVPLKTAEFKEGNPLVIINDNNNCESEDIKELIEIEKQKYMYDLSVEDNHNFALENGILAHNSFRPPASEKFIQGQTQVFGFIWEDEELYEYLIMAVDDFNSRPPVTDLEFSGLWGSERRWRTTVILRAAAFACFAIAMNWIADEFSVGGDEKVNVKLPTGEIISISLEELFLIIYGENIQKASNQAKESIQELKYGFKGKFFEKLFSKLRIWNMHRKNKNFLKIKEAFEDTVLEVNSYNKRTKETEWKTIRNVFRHDAQGKKIVNVIAGKKKVKVTTDHSLYSYATKLEIETNKIRPDQSIVIIDILGNIQPLSVDEIKPARSERYMYDLSVEDNENFFLASGILAHNSYSISGVSLDIEKSSKYQAMKDEYIAEYDKLVEQNKLSIKIVKGLRQFKYGVGITSALGPMNRPGVQSRRNLISSGAGPF